MHRATCLLSRVTKTKPAHLLCVPAVRAQRLRPVGLRWNSTPPNLPKEGGSAARSAGAPNSAAAGESTSGWRGPVSWATLVLLVGTGAAAVVYYNVKRAQKKVEGKLLHVTVLQALPMPDERVAAATKVETFGRPSLGGPWSLVDAEGRPTTSGDFAGKYHLLYFGFTFCPDICPNELVKMGKVVDGLAKRQNVPEVIPIFITLDPHRDSCAQVGAYARDFHPRMVGLTGTPGQVAKVAKAFRVYFADVDRKEDDDEYLVDHSIVMYLMGPDGQFIDFFTQLMTVPEITDKIAATIVQKPASASITRMLGFGKRD